VLHVFPDLASLSRAAAEALVNIAARAVAERGRFTIALSGGETPRTLYRLLATDCREQVPWPHVHVFWGDERFVAPDDPRSDYRTARDTLLDHVPIPSESVHPIPTLMPSPEAAADAYEETLVAYFGSPWPRFDLMLLGLGAEGHTASLFPHSPALDEEARWVVAATVPADPPQRITLTLPAVNHAAHVYFLVSGAEKAAALRAALTDPPDVHACPASGVKLVNGELVWWADQPATGRLI